MQAFRGAATTSILAAALACVATAATAQSSPAVPQGAWSARTPLPAARNEVAAAVVADKIYVLGGSVRETQYDLTRNEEYDTVTDRWRERAPMPHGLNHIASVSLNGKVYT